MEVSPESCSKGRKRMKMSNDGEDRSLPASSKVVDYSDPFAIRKMIKGLDSGKYGSVTKDMEAIINRKLRVFSPLFAKYPELCSKKSSGDEASRAKHVVVDLEDNSNAYDTPVAVPVVILDSDEEDGDCGQNFPFEETVWPMPTGASSVDMMVSGRKANTSQEVRMASETSDTQVREKMSRTSQEVRLASEMDNTQVSDHAGRTGKEVRLAGEMDCTRVGGHAGGTSQVVRLADEMDCTQVSGRAGSTSQEVKLAVEMDIEKDKGVYVGIEDDTDGENENEDDGLGDMWNEMLLALECSKDVAEYHSPDEPKQGNEDYCEHSFILKDDIGYVCRVCGIIEKGIESIIEVHFNKAKKSTRTYPFNSRNAKDKDSNEVGVAFELAKEDEMVADISAHPRQMKMMKPHQVEGFNFLCSNLIRDKPGGCILAHAPGSGKTFMIISFVQSFLAKYPDARPLVVLPKGILSTWKREFQKWQVEDLPLFDLYSAKADSRHQQLEVLKKWVEQRSILFLGYQQFSSIVCDNGSKFSESCQEILLRQSSILILDEGHTPRNDDTDVLQSLAKVQTPRKVVLSGTLYQNHVKEVFNILNLVHPRFLRLETSRKIVKRIMSKVDMAGFRKHIKPGADAAFYELVEHTIQRDHDFKRKVSIIHDLREMTQQVLHYYKGDFLDELPGLIDFTVVLNLSPRQRNEVEKLMKLPRKFKRSSVGSALYLHPKLISFFDNSSVTDDKMDELLDRLDVKDGVKTKFFLNVMNLCESSGEKLLVFSQYLTPLKFLGRLLAKVKGWALGREVFMILGESSSDQREWSMERFNSSPDAKVFFGSIKACGEGISLVGASRILILDVHLNPSVTRQAIGRAFRPGQKKKVYAYRLVAADSPEEEDHATCFRKEAIAKMWFEWNESCGYNNFEVKPVALKHCGDLFLESPVVGEDVRALYTR